MALTKLTLIWLALVRPGSDPGPLLPGPSNPDLRQEATRKRRPSPEMLVAYSF